MGKDLNSSLTRLLIVRVVFASLLLGSTYLTSSKISSRPLDPIFIWIYSLSFSLLLLSLVYYILLRTTSFGLFGAFIQIFLDSVAVTIIIYLTGGYDSLFTFLYLIVIIYTSTILYRQGSVAITICCAIQYAGVAGLQYLNRIQPYEQFENMRISSYSFSQLGYKVIVTTMAFLAVAILSNILAEQSRKSKTKLKAMAERVRRVEKLAAMGEMAAGLAHEIKNPLAAMTGSIQMLREDLPADSGRQKLMNIVTREADRLTNLINDFLLFARPPTGRFETIELNEVITHTVELFAHDARFAANVDFRTQLIAGVYVSMDSALLRQVFWNLLLNAAESIEGEGKIEISSRRMAKGKAEVTIKDSGCGIPPENLETIFNPFFTTKPKGTGLGLSIVYSILESSGAQMEVASKVGDGTIFHLIMPTVQPPEQTSPPN